MKIEILDHERDITFKQESYRVNLPLAFRFPVSHSLGLSVTSLSYRIRDLWIINCHFLGDLSCGSQNNVEDGECCVLVEIINVTTAIFFHNFQSILILLITS